MRTCLVPQNLPSFCCSMRIFCFDCHRPVTHDKDFAALRRVAQNGTGRTGHLGMEWKRGRLSGRKAWEQNIRRYVPPCGLELLQSRPLYWLMRGYHSGGFTTFPTATVTLLLAWACKAQRKERFRCCCSFFPAGREGHPLALCRHRAMQGGRPKLPSLMEVLGDSCP